MKKAILPLITMFSFYAESVFASMLPFIGNRLSVPHFLLVVLTIMGIYYFRDVTLIYAAIFGLLFDIYFTGLIGIYLFLFPIAVYAAAKLMKVFQINILTAGLVTLVNLLLVEFAVYGLYSLIYNTGMPIVMFLDHRLWPTLLLNLVFYAIIIIPFSNWLQKRRKEIAD